MSPSFLQSVQYEGKSMCDRDLPCKICSRVISCQDSYTTGVGIARGIDSLAPAVLPLSALAVLLLARSGNVWNHFPPLLYGGFYRTSKSRSTIWFVCPQPYRNVTASAVRVYGLRRASALRPHFRGCYRIQVLICGGLRSLIFHHHLDR